EVYNAQLIEPGKMISERRKAFIESFREILQQMYNAISGQRETIDCQYDSKFLENTFEELLAHAEEKDRVLQRSTVGIHRDDLFLKIDEHPAKQFASQGQLKSLALSLKLAQYEVLRREKKMQPLLLLDDIFDKLDKNRVRQLLELLLQQSFGQIFITDTDEQRIQDILSKLNTSYCIYLIEEGVATLSHII
ncbi:MAG: DNA replication and repair protein RecF, partial [Saprospiraceae bacterium]|nr:DNA replication and repair protein RecF [Saprospiraceae bacterium]